jgi:uncharacterized protein (DUF1015 family)
MAIIKEFMGLRPKKEFVERVSVLPYDVVSTEEARRIAKDNDVCFFHVSKPEIDFPDNIDTHDRTVFQHGKDYLYDMKKKGVFTQEAEPCLYLYTQIMDGREQTGLIACVSIDDYINKTIKKHELTREDKELERTTHIDILGANTGQVFLFFNDADSKKGLFNAAMQEPVEYDFVSGDGVRQIVRIIRDTKLIHSIKVALKDDVLYIADGHHRAAAAVRVATQRRKDNPGFSGDEDFNYFMAVIFPHSQLKILPYNRIVRDLNGMNTDQFMDVISGKFTISKTGNPAPASVHEICMYLEKTWYLLRPRFDPGTDPIGSLDVNILQENILIPILGIQNPRTDKRIDFVGGKKSVGEIQKKVDDGSFKVAFSLYPTTIEQLMRVSDTDGIMPPKSTWFEPKLQSGVVVHLL